MQHDKCPTFQERWVKFSENEKTYLKRISFN